MKNISLTLLVFIVSLSQVIVGQENMTITVEEACRFALAHNRQLVASDYSVAKSEQQLREAIANGLPQVNAAIDYSNSLGAVMSIRFNESMPATEIPIKPSSTLNLTVGQLIFSGNYIVGIQTARLGKELSQMNRSKTELEVLSQVTESYYLVLVSSAIHQLLLKNETNLKSLYDKTAPLERVGIMEKTSLEQLEVQLNTLSNAIRSSERQLELATNLLRLQMGASVETEIQLSSTLEEVVAQTKPEILLADPFTTEQNIDYRMLYHQELIGRKMVDMKRANALPSVSAFYQYTHKLLEPNFDMMPDNTVGLQLNIPIFSSGVRTAQTRQAELDLKTIRNTKALLDDQLKVQEKQLKFNLTSAIETYYNQQKNVEVSRRVYQSLKLKYEQGMISGLDLINADNNYLKAETDYISAIMELLSSTLQLKKLYGKII